MAGRMVLEFATRFENAHFTKLLLASGARAHSCTSSRAVKATGTGGMPGVRDASGSAHVSTATLFKSPIEHVLHAEALPLLAPAGAL